MSRCHFLCLCSFLGSVLEQFCSCSHCQPYIVSYVHFLVMNVIVITHTHSHTHTHTHTCIHVHSHVHSHITHTQGDINTTKIYPHHSMLYLAMTSTLYTVVCIIVIIILILVLLGLLYILFKRYICVCTVFIQHLSTCIRTCVIFNTTIFKGMCYVTLCDFTIILACGYVFVKPV